MPSISSVVAVVVGLGSLAAAVPYGAPDVPYDPSCPAETPYLMRYPQTTSQCLTKTYTKVVPLTTYVPAPVAAAMAAAARPTPPGGAGGGFPGGAGGGFPGGAGGGFPGGSGGGFPGGSGGSPPSFHKRYEGIADPVRPPPLVPVTTCITKTMTQVYTKTITYQATRTAMAPRYCSGDMSYYDPCCPVVQVVQQVAPPPQPVVVPVPVQQIAAPVAVPVQQAAPKPAKAAPSEDEGGDIKINNDNKNANKANNKVNATNHGLSTSG